MKLTKRDKVVLAVAAVLVAMCVYFYFDPSDNLFPRCPFLVAIGYQCPGCGSQRAIHALLHGDIVSAWHFNAMLVVFIPLIVVLIVAEFRRTRAPHFYRLVNSAAVIWTSAAVLILWWIFRNF